MKKDYRERLTYGSAVFMLLFGVVLTTAGFVIDPAGQIHDSVLYVLGQCLIFSGSVMGVGAYATGKMRHIEDSVRRDIDNRFRAYEGHRTAAAQETARYEDINDNIDDNGTAAEENC